MHNEGMRGAPDFSSLSAEDVADGLIALLAGSRDQEYFGEPVSQLHHAEQCAHLARSAGADEELILAALLHDIGHLIDPPGSVRDARVGVVNHDATGEAWLLGLGFSARVASLVGGHVDAKRYLVAVNPAYGARLSEASTETLRLQGGAMTAEEAKRFSEGERLRDVLRLRSWDEQAKDPGWTGDGVESYRAMMVRHVLGGARGDQAR